MDRIEFEETIRNTNSPRDLYLLQERVCKFRENREILMLEFEELTHFIKERFKELGRIRAAVDS